ncbi:MAG TPA: undecaprenyl-diphosphate phosphatase [Candidatus Dormibacteraeota bacterium]|nr:undecaprenyl-diphosphate phosphatase [Candidatus Dormibacteraeota bacterium]
MNFWQAIFLGALQGSTELFPVSSLGHAVVLPALLHWNYKESDPTFLPFLVLLHLGTASALLIIFWEDWVTIASGFARAAFRGRIERPDERLAMLLVVGTVPTGAVGLVLQDPLQSLFANPRAAGAFLVGNAVILIGAEMLRRRDERRSGRSESRDLAEEHYTEISGLSFKDAALVGACQILALLPGVSRSGVTIAGGLVAGLRHQEAARFSFLLATPIIAAAGLLKVPLLIGSSVNWPAYLAGAVVAGVTAFVSAKFLIRYFRVGRLDPYAGYCAALGLLTLVLVR